MVTSELDSVNRVALLVSWASRAVICKLGRLSRKRMKSHW